MKKIIALALALVMALSMASVAFAAAITAEAVNAKGEATYAADKVYAPGTKIVLDNFGGHGVSYTKVSATDFTSASKDYKGASYIESVKISKADKQDVVITLRESYTLDTLKAVLGSVTVKDADGNEYTHDVAFDICNSVPATELLGEKKVKNVDADNTVAVAANTVQVMDEDGGYVKFTKDDLVGFVKMNAEEKVYLNITGLGEDAQDAFDALVGEDYLDEAIIEYYNFETRAFKNEVDFQYDAYAEDPHFFYAFDGEKLTAIDAEYNDDEEVEKYEFTAIADGAIIITDTEIVLAAEEETKNPDTGANDVVGVAAALAVVSLVAAGAVSLKK